MKTDVSHIVDLLAEDSEILLIYVFGSTAADTSHALSDIDIAVLLPQREPEYFIRKEKDLFLFLAEQGVGSVDLLVLNVAGIELQHKVITAGKLLFSRSEDDRIRFEENALLAYFDNKPLFDEYDAMVHQRIKSRPKATPRRNG